MEVSGHKPESWQAPETRRQEVCFVLGEMPGISLLEKNNLYQPFFLEVGDTVMW